MKILTKEQILLLHSQLIEGFGGSSDIRDNALLDSAINTPFQTYDSEELYPTLLDKASRLCFGLVKNHPFVDGNKRIGTHAMLVFLAIPMAVIAAMIKLDSKGPVFFRQERVTQYGRIFKIYKFRTMVNNASCIGSQVTVAGDARITKVGKFLRKFRLDEFPQLFNIIAGDMTLVGTRPEVPKYVKHYTPEMYATLLLPAGLTSRTSIAYKDEDKLLKDAKNADKTYVEQILPVKMQYNLESLRKFGLVDDCSILWNTFYSVIRK